MKFVQDFRKDFVELQRAVHDGERFAFTRFGTGEFGVIQGRKTHAGGSGWTYHGEETEYHRAMDAAWRYGGEGWHIGISCPCCNPPEFRWYANNLHVLQQKMTFATLFMGANWPASREWGNDLRKKGWLLIGPRNSDITIPENVMEPTEFDYEPVLQAMFKADRPFLLAAGILAKILAWRYWATPGSPRQSIIDIGSAFDLEMFGRPTRVYLQPRWVTRPRTPQERAVAKRRNAIVGRCCVWKVAKYPVHNRSRK